MNFMIYDLTLLVLFAIFIGIFLYTRRKNLTKEGLLFLYKTSWGIKLINYVGKKFKRTMKVLSYISIGLGYCLMAGVLYLFYNILKIYLFRPDVVTAVKIPPIMPLIPYLPRLFNLSFLPDFYFVYWIIILAIIAITHEFAHGIFAVYNKVKVKTTGFGFFPFFLPVFLAAFVELDEKKMAKKSKLSQMAVLSAGTFANVLTAVFFFGVLWLFFSFAFTPAGVVFDTYSYSIVEVAGITMVNGVLLETVSYQNVLDLMEKEKLNEVVVDEQKYLIEKDLFELQGKQELFEEVGRAVLFNDAPAINAELGQIIKKVNGVQIESIEMLSSELDKYSVGEKVTITCLEEDHDLDYEIILEENPMKEGKSWLGIGFIDKTRTGVIGSVYNVLSKFKKPSVYYEPVIDGWSWFIYNLLWWTILISLSVALVNMLPVGIFDGGRFFYLTILGITGSESKAKKTFSIVTYFFLLLLAVIMFFWALSFF